MKTRFTPAAPQPTAGRPSLLESWIRFWFAPGDPIVLGLVRVVAGVVLLYVLASTTFALQEYYGPDGWYDLKTADVFRKEAPNVAPPLTWDESVDPEALPRKDLPDRPDQLGYRKRWGLDPKQASDEGLDVFSVWFHVTDPTAMAVVQGAFCLVGVLFLLGVWTRITSVLAWFAFLCYAHRNPFACFGMDAMLSTLLLYLMIGPSGAALSVDRLLALRRTRRAGLPDAPPPRSASATFALRLVQIHFCIIYLASGLSKLQGAAWWNGTALWQTFTNYEFSGPPPAYWHDFLLYLAGNRWAWELFVGGGCLFTLVLEISLPYLIWVSRWRWVLLASSTLLHTGIALGMGGLGSFSLAMLGMLCAFVPPEALHAVFDRVARFRGRPALPLAPQADREPAPAGVPPTRTAIRA